MWRYYESLSELLTTMVHRYVGRHAYFALSAFVCLLAFSSTVWGQCEIEKITAQDGGASDLFAYSVSVSGEFALIGSSYYDGVASNSGAAYVYRYDVLSGNWTVQEILTASDAQPGPFGDFFGHAVYINDNMAVIGAPLDDEACPNSPKFCNSGSAYVFRFDPKLSHWIEEDKLFASDGDIEDQFGTAVSISGDVAIIGVPLDDDVKIGFTSGSAYVFRKDPKSNNWIEEAKLTASDANAGGHFGRGVAIQNDVAVIVGNSNNKDLGVYAGTAYVFQFDPKTGMWNEEHKLTASDAANFNGFSSVSLSDDLVVIGVSGDDDGGMNSGAAYVFRYDAKAKLWTELDKLTASDAEPNDRLGQSISLSNDLILVGARLDDDACPIDPGCDSGSAYLFQYDPKTDSWLEKAKLTASDPSALDDFGRSVSISGNLAIIGSPGDDEIAPSAGAVYSFDLSACLCPADLDGDGSVNTSDLLALFAQWGPNPGSQADLDGDGIVNTTDLLTLFANWGPCA